MIGVDQQARSPIGSASARNGAQYSCVAMSETMVDGYPRRHLYVTTDTMTGATPLIFWCVEMLETKGFRPSAPWTAQDVAEHAGEVFFAQAENERAIA